MWYPGKYFGTEKDSRYEQGKQSKVLICIIVM